MPGKKTGTLSGPTMVTDNNGNGTPNFGDQITFTVDADWQLYPSVLIEARQNGEPVYRQAVGFYPTYPGDPFFTLGGAHWTSGAADCTASLVYTDKQGRVETLDSLVFSVDA